MRVPTSGRMLLQSRFKITSTADVQRIVGATKNVDPRHPVIMLIGLRSRQESVRKLWTSRLRVVAGSMPFDRLRAQLPRSDLGPGLRQHVAQDLLHLVELGLATDQWGSDLDDRVAAVVGAAVQAVLEQRV
jgi:hypothetical protein